MKASRLDVKKLSYGCCKNYCSLWTLVSIRIKTASNFGESTKQVGDVGVLPVATRLVVMSIHLGAEKSSKNIKQFGVYKL